MNRACFPKEKHQNSQKWAKFMNFSFWPFLWFGLPGRLLRNGCRCNFQGFHSLAKGNQVSVLRIYFSEPDSDRRSTDLGAGRGKTILKHYSKTDAAFLLTVGSFLLTAERFAYSCVWELFCLQFLSFLLPVRASFFQFELFCSQLSFFAYNGQVCLRNTSTDCKQRS